MAVSWGKRGKTHIDPTHVWDEIQKAINFKEKNEKWKTRT